MKRNDFIEYIKENYVVDPDFDRQFELLEHSDTDGDFIYENDMIAIGKFFYTLPLETQDGKPVRLNFCIISVYTKCYVAIDDYEFASSEYVDYQII